MEIFYKKKRISNKTEWKEAFRRAYTEKGQTDKWKDGRSAERLADDFFQETPECFSSGEKTIRNMISFFTKCEKVNLDSAQIEYLSKFDSHNNPRQQDLAIWGAVNDTPLFVGLEAKVDEPFDNRSIEKARQAAKISPTATDRISLLVEDFLKGIPEEEYNSFRYQLLFYLAGSLREPSAEIIFMPVIVYVKGSVDYHEENAAKNKRDYQQFMEKLFKPMPVPKNNEIELAYEQDFETWDCERAKRIHRKVYSCYIVKR